MESPDKRALAFHPPARGGAVGKLKQLTGGQEDQKMINDFENIEMKYRNKIKTLPDC
jgi:hypothetical protein